MNKADDHGNNKVRGLMRLLESRTTKSRESRPKSKRPLKKVSTAKPLGESIKVLVRFLLVVNNAIAPQCLEA